MILHRCREIGSVPVALNIDISLTIISINQLSALCHMMSAIVRKGPPKRSSTGIMVVYSWNLLFHLSVPPHPSSYSSSKRRGRFAPPKGALTTRRLRLKGLLFLINVSVAVVAETEGEGARAGGSDHGGVGKCVRHYQHSFQTISEMLLRETYRAVVSIDFTRPERHQWNLIIPEPSWQDVPFHRHEISSFFGAFCDLSFLTHSLARGAGRGKTSNGRAGGTNHGGCGYWLGHGEPLPRLQLGGSLGI